MQLTKDHQATTPTEARSHRGPHRTDHHAHALYRGGTVKKTSVGYNFTNMTNTTSEKNI